MSDAPTEAPNLAYSSWYNGDPNLQIQFGTYVRNRPHLKGFTESQLERFDKLNEEVNGDDDRSLSERKREEAAKVKAALAKKKESSKKKEEKKEEKKEKKSK